MIGNSNNNPNKKYHYVKVVSKDAEGKELDKPYFSFKAKVGDKYEEVAKENSFKGNVTSVVVGEHEYKGVTSPTVKITVEDGDEVYIFDQLFSIASRSVFNSLLSLESLEDITFQVYLTKPNEKYGSKRFKQISLRQGSENELVKWALEKDEMPETKKVRINGKEMIDSEELDNFLIGKLKTKFDKLNGGKKQDTPKKDAEQVDSGEIDDSEVPF